MYEFTLIINVYNIINLNQGVLCGLFAGEAFGLWVLIGSLIYPSKISSLDTSIEECPAELLHNSTSVNKTPIETTGLLRLYHVAFLLVPISGFIISACVGTLMSLLTGKQIICPFIIMVY